MSIIRPFIAVHREKKLIKMLIIYPNFKIYFHKWCQFNLQELSFLIIYIFLYLIYVSTFNEDTKPGMLTCTDTKIWFHKDNRVKNVVPKIPNFSQSYPFLPEASFGLRVLSLPPSVCLCVCVCVNHLLVRAITCRPFKLESPNLDQKSKTPWLRSLLFWGLIDLELQGQI